MESTTLFDFVRSASSLSFRAHTFKISGYVRALNVLATLLIYQKHKIFVTSRFMKRPDESVLSLNHWINETTNPGSLNAPPLN